METTEKALAHKRNKRLLIWITSLLLFIVMAIFIFYLTLAVYASSRWVRETNNEFAAKEGAAADPELHTDEAFIALQKEIAFKKARLKMAATDSIGLSINLPDSLLLLEVSGVTVASVKINKQKLSRSFRGIEHTALAGLLSNALLTTNSTSTIVKEPIIEKMAPRDTLEANLPEKTVDTTKNEPVFFELALEKGIRLFVLQEETTALDRTNRFNFMLKRSMAKAARNLKSIFRFELPDYHPEILLIIPASDARAIYRALPEKGRVAIHM
ncbi:MAG: hypothetical protein IH597_03195 [Bacteroidales bacterium]|nr:hypothetical protein [Bacteroidales bacterium]